MKGFSIVALVVTLAFSVAGFSIRSSATDTSSSNRTKAVLPEGSINPRVDTSIEEPIAVGQDKTTSFMLEKVGENKYRIKGIIGTNINPEFMDCFPYAKDYGISEKEEKLELAKTPRKYVRVLK